MGEVARGDDQLRLYLLDQPGERRLDLAVLACARVQVGKVEDACSHERMRLYIRL
jgi:hypothetical protein